MSTWTESKIKRYAKEGRGRGEKEHYVSWLNTTDIPGNYKDVFTLMPFSWKNKRSHLVISELAIDYFLTLQWDDSVVDIRENFPLDLTETITLAKDLKITHEKCSKNNIPIVMTSSFLVTQLMDGIEILKAVDVCKSNKLESKKTSNQLKIKKQYWNSKGIQHVIVTENDINFTLSRNIFILDTFKRAMDRVITEDLCNKILDKLEEYNKCLNDNRLEGNDSMERTINRILRERQFDITLHEFNKIIAEENSVLPGDIFGHVFFMIANKVILIDVENELLKIDNVKIKNLFVINRKPFEIDHSVTGVISRTINNLHFV